jgi:hypothetical protein
LAYNRRRARLLLCGGNSRHLALCAGRATGHQSRQAPPAGLTCFDGNFLISDRPICSLLPVLYSVAPEAESIAKWAAKIGCRNTLAHIERTHTVIKALDSDRIVKDLPQHIIGWTKAWYEQALAANFVSFPFRVDDEMVKRLHQYFREGLTPEEALLACIDDVKQ